MQMIKKLFTALRGGTHEVAEMVVDANAIRIIDQEIRDATADQAEAKEALTKLLAQEATHKNKIEALNLDIESLTQKALKADAKGDQELAVEIATAVGQKTQERDAQQKLVDQFTAFVAQQRATVLEVDRRIKNARTQAEIVKARESIQSAQKSVSAAGSSTTSGLNNAMESLNRKQAQQDMVDEQIKARNALDAETSGASLDARIKAAGLEDDKYDGASILANLKKNTPAA
jgi:phage shock protein A